MQRTIGTTPELIIAGNELVSGLMIALITRITVAIAEITMQTASTLLCFDTLIPPSCL